MQSTEPGKTSPRGSTLLTRNVTVSGRRTSVRLEPYMWEALQELCERECRTVHEVCTLIAHRQGSRGSFTAALRVAILAYFRLAASDGGNDSLLSGTLDALASSRRDTVREPGQGSIPSLEFPAAR